MVSTESKFRQLKIRKKEDLQDHVILRKLDVDSELEIARDLDFRSEGINPSAMTKKDRDRKMSDVELQRWVEDRDEGMLRVIFKDGKAIGFIYLYNDESWDTDFKMRANLMRAMQRVPDDYPVWEMNFWFEEGTDDGVVFSTVNNTLLEFVNLHQDEKTLLMVADQRDLRDAWQRATNSPSTLRGAWSSDKLEIAKSEFQDTRILALLGLDYVCSHRYEADGANDLFYATTVGGDALLMN